MDGAKIRKSNIIPWHTTPRGPNSVPTEAQSRRELQEVAMISQARVVVLGGGIDGR
jgi:hypothetical protein